MADKPEKDLPKVPPFIIPGTSNQPVEEPAPQAAREIQAPKPKTENNQTTSPPGIFSTLILLISATSLGIAMISGAWFAYGVLGPEPNREAGIPAQPQDPISPEPVSNDVLPKIIVVGLAYIVGWIVGVIGVRSFGNLILPYVIQAYAWTVLGGIIVLQVLIISRLYRQEYVFTSYVKYLFLFGAGLVALIGLHLILEKHSLIPFAIPILLASLGHLYFIVFHYVFVPEVKNEYLWGDVIFFLTTTLVSILMLAHLGFLNGLRKTMDHMFSPNDAQYSPPN